GKHQSHVIVRHTNAVITVNIGYGSGSGTFHHNRSAYNFRIVTGITYLSGHCFLCPSGGNRQQEHQHTCCLPECEIPLPRSYVFLHINCSIKWLTTDLLFVSYLEDTHRK